MSLNPTLKNRPQQMQKGRPKTGGRKKGTPDRVDRKAAARAIEAAIDEARRVSGKAADKAAKDLTPLGFMTEVLRQPSAYPFVARQWAAKEAAPYIHRKMPVAVELVDDGSPPTPISVTINYKDARRSTKVKE